jgi:holo-[acyl-carrier protein] synthase
MMLRTGIDLVEISRFEELNPAIRERFFQRVFTPQELREAQGLMPSLAGRFAAKEAVAKALGCGIGPVAWREIEIREGSLGEPVLELHGAARLLADQYGLVEWAISISHTRAQAAAVAVALGPGQHIPDQA